MTCRNIIFLRFCAIVNLSIECTFLGSCVAFEFAYCSHRVTVDFALRPVLGLHVLVGELRPLTLQFEEEVRECDDLTNTADIWKV